MREDFIFTSESVTEGHPDKMCDQISDAMVDHFLRQDPYARILAECAVFSNIVFIAARYASSASVDLAYVARKVIQQIGYDQPDFNARSCSILTTPQERPPDGKASFDENELSEKEIARIPVRNQVTVFGFACDQTETFMPLSIWLAHKLARRLMAVRRKEILPYLMPDGKVQLGVEYKDRKAVRVHGISITASQKSPDSPDLKRLFRDITETVIEPVFAEQEIRPDDKTRIFVNPDGPFVGGGPSHHSGLTGRKNAIDTYGEYARHSGKALSGKDPLRIDRIGAYAARYAALNAVAAGLATECEVQLSYSIGLSQPVSVQVETFGTGQEPDARIAARLKKQFDFRLAGILKAFGLRHLPALHPEGFYQRLAAYGHVGRWDIPLPWEKADRAKELAED